MAKKISVASVMDDIQLLINKIRMESELNYLSSPCLNLYYSASENIITGFLRFSLYEYVGYDVLKLETEIELFMEEFRILLGADELELSYTKLEVSRDWDDIDIHCDIHYVLRDGVYFDKIVKAHKIECERERAKKKEVAKRRREKAAAEVKRKESEEYELFLSLKSKFEGND